MSIHTHSVLIVVHSSVAFEYVVWIEDALIVVLQYGADALALRVSHTSRDLRPFALRGAYFEATWNQY